MPYYSLCILATSHTGRRPCCTAESRTGKPFDMEKEMTTKIPLESLNEELAAHILFYLDFPSAAVFRNSVSKEWKRQLSGNGSMRHVWMCLFSGFGFSSEGMLEAEKSVESILQEFRYRWSLRRALFSPPYKKHQNIGRKVIQLPNHNVRFLPILPTDEQGIYLQYHLQHPSYDYPPVNWDCDSFVLTSTATGPQFFLLNPSSDVLSLYASVTDNTFGSMLDLKKVKALPQSEKYPMPKLAPPQHVFSPDTVAARSLLFQHSTQQFSDTEQRKQTKITYVGIESHAILNKQGRATGSSLLVMGRSITAMHGLCCTEFFAWTVDTTGNITNRSACRPSGLIQNAVICAQRRWVFATFHRAFVSREEESRIHVFLLNEEEDQPAIPLRNDSLMFAKSLFTLECKTRGVVGFAVCPTGQTLIVSTRPYGLIIWRIEGEQIPQLEQEIDVFSALSVETPKQQETARQPRLFRVEAVLTPRIQPVDSVGFCTLVCTNDRSHKVVLWCKNEEWAVQGVVNLPLSTSRLPVLHFDGQRLVVFGEDQYGLILLVYSIEKLAEAMSVETKGELDGGVVPAPGAERVFRFRNRIRSEALGGVELNESLHMTCNERYIVVNTKAGNKMAGDDAVPIWEGLLIFDLDVDAYGKSIAFAGTVLRVNK